VFAPEAVVYHWHGETIWRYIRRKFSYGYWRTFMYHWHPEKIFHDSHTPGSQRWQLLALALILGLLPVWFFWPAAGWLILFSTLVFFGSALSFFSHIWRNDRPVLLVSPTMILARSGALGFGFVYGLVFPWKAEDRSLTGLSAPQRFLKRALDICGALVGLILSSPLFLVAAIAIKIDSPGPILFSQERVGENGKPFRVYKLRTMFVGAEEQLDELLHTNPLKGLAYKIPDDPRITRVGRFLRRWSLDEIPQFWNILRGDMSLVGPRPEQTWMVARYDDYHRQRLVVKPGLTGPMQVEGRAELNMDERMALEIDYIKNYSIWQDIRIILRTIPVTISGKGAS